MSVVIHAFPPSPRSFKVLLAAEHLDIDYRLKFTNLAAGEQFTPESTRLNVNQRMPVLVDGDYALWESNAILEYLASLAPEAGFMPSVLRSRLQIAKWLYWEAADWDPACIPIVFERVGKQLMSMGPPDEAETDRAFALFDRAAKVLDSVLEGQRYIAYDRLTAADFAVVAPLRYAEQARLPLANYPSISRWLADMQALPAWSRTVAMQASPEP
ncbi:MULTISPECIES: glutathione S-transferase family protein [unclassified Brevundimonas]|uniref:glutathione S-transferase family protein n=1 Tax=unclassified Brevundimonas TaxID=2622653 RepID=UPI0025BCF1CA|nr:MULTISPECIES: glutathione S-transferase family protein [unclassified Brevundimonas]